MRSAGLGVRQGKAGEGKSDGYPVGSPGKEAVELADGASVSKAFGHLPHPDDGNGQSGGVGIDLGRCFLLPEPDPCTGREGDDARHEEQVPERTHQRTAEDLSEEDGFSSYVLSRQRQTQADNTLHAEGPLSSCV